MSGSSYQTTVSLSSASSGNLNAYFKLKAPDPGAISLTKTTEDGQNLSGWRFGVYTNSACTSLAAGPYTTNSSGKISVTGLTPGAYYVKEIGQRDSAINALYYCSSTNPQSVTVTAGATATVSFTNKLNTGSIKLIKATNTGANLSGWQIGLYTDADCTNTVSSSPFTTGADGRLKISKTVEGGGSVEGWQFKITDAEGKVLDGSPFSTDEDGIILTGNLLPGQYTIEELLPEDSLYECKGDNPQTVTVKQGGIAEVSFINALRTGKVTVEKIDITGSPLAGATFRLEWSAEGSLWYPVTYSETIVRGGCSNPDVVDGSLTTGADGILEWGNLYTGLQYRLTETKAPDGYKLLEKAAYEGELPADDLTLSVRVTNTRTFTMPDTGVGTGLVLRVLSMVAAIGCLMMILLQKKLAKRK